MKKRYIIVYSSVFLLSFLFGAHSHGAECVMSSPYWPSASKRVGETMTMSIQGMNCAGQSIKFEIYGDISATIDPLIKTVTATFPSSGSILTANVFFSHDEFIRAGGDDSGVGKNASIYFIASTPTREIESPRVDIEWQATATPLPPAPPAPPGPVAVSVAGTNMDLGVTIKPFGPDNLLDVVNDIANWIVAISVPLATILIIYAGILFITAKGDPGQVGKAKGVLTIVITGMAIILIGKGFVSLVQSILGWDAPPIP